MDELDQAFRESCRTRFKSSWAPEERAEASWSFEVEGLPDLSVILGEVVQNLRSALDYLVYDLALFCTGKQKIMGTQFPIATTAANYFNTGRHQVRPLSGDLRRRIRKLQPYQLDRSDPATHPLAVLSRLSNADKHRVLTLVAHNLRGMDTIVGHIDKGTVRFGGENVGTEMIARPAYLRADASFDEIRRANPTIGAIQWLELGIAGDTEWSVFDVLKNLLWTVTEIVDSFDPVFGLTEPPSPSKG